MPTKTIFLVPCLLAIALVELAPKNSAAADVSAAWLGGIGNWDDGTQWTTNPNYPNNGNGITYNATIASGSATLDRDITLRRLFFNGGALTGSFDLTLNKGLTWTAGSLSSSGAINLSAGSTSTISSAGLILDGPTINNSGIVNQSASIESSGAIINNLAGATWSAQPDSRLGVGGSAQVIFNNSGSFVVASAPAGFTEVAVGAVFNNTGSVTIQSSGLGDNSLTLEGGGSASGSFNVEANAKLIFSPFAPPPTYTLTSGATITGAGATENYGPLFVAGNTTISTSLLNQGSIVVQSGATLTLNGSFSQFLSGGIHLNGGTITSTQTLGIGLNSSLSGSGIVNANVEFIRGNLLPGDVAAAGKLTINGNLFLDFDTFTFMKIGGLTQGTQYDFIAVAGQVALDGILFLQMINGFESQLDASQTFILLTSNSLLTGEFANVANGERLLTLDGTGSFLVNYGLGSPYGGENLVLSSPMAVPEPVSVVLLAIGSALIGLVRLRRRQCTRPALSVLICTADNAR